MWSFRVTYGFATILMKYFHEQVSPSDEEPELGTLEFFTISHSSCKPLNFLHYLTLSTL